MTMSDPKAAYEAKWAEYQAVMHRGAWRIGWGFFFVTVGLLPMMWVFIWMVGAGNWENTVFHAPLLMWAAVPLNLTVVVALVFHLYRKNLELDAVKRAYLTELRALKSKLPHTLTPEPARESAPDPDSFRDDN
jgi:magnesium-transporting ATPase (P-type)